MKILYMHGLREDPVNNPIVRALSGDYEIIAPKIDPLKPRESFEALNNTKADMTVAYSLGGFFASRVTSPSSPLLLINPALGFVGHLKKRRKPRWEIIKEYESLPPIFNAIPEKIKAIFTTEDYSIGLKALPIYLEYFPESTITKIPGGHNLSEESIQNSVLPIVKTL